MQWISVNKWMNAFQLLIILSQRSFHKSFCYIVTDACTIQSSGEFSGTWEALWGPLLAGFFFVFFFLTGLDLSSGVVVCSFLLQFMENRLYWASVVVTRKLSFPAVCGVLAPQLGIEPISLLLKDWFLTPGPPWKWHDWTLSSHRFDLCILIRESVTSLPSPRTLYHPVWIEFSHK